MFNSIHLKIEAGLLAILAIVLFLAHHYYTSYQEQKDQKENVEKLFSKKSAEVELYKNRQGQIVAKTQAIELENKTIKQLVKDGNLPWLKNFEGLKSNFKNLETAFQVQSKLIDSLKAKIHDHQVIYIDKKGDTVKFTAHDINFKDKWSEITVKQISPDSANLKYSIDVPLEGVSYWHRKWFLGKKHEEIEVTSENPHVKINKVLHITTSKKK